MVKVRVLACPHCGGKLRWRADVPIIECRYCHTHVVVETGRTTHLPAQAISRPPVRAGWIAVPIAIVFVGGITGYAMTAKRSGTTTAAPAKQQTSTMAELAATPLAETPVEVAKRHGVSPLRDNFVRVLLSDGPFEYAYLHWDAGTDHISQIGLYPRNKEDELAEAVSRARDQLGHRFQASSSGGFQFSARGARLGVSRYWYVGVDHDDPRWRERLSAVWTVTKGAALGTADRLDDHARRDVLNIGYDLFELTKIDLETVVDNAASEVRRVAAGAEDRGDSQEIGLAHPWFDNAWLRWDNKPNGKLGYVVLYAPQGHDLTKHADALSVCLEPLLGEPERRVTDHLAGEFSLNWKARKGHPSIHVSGQTLQLGIQDRWGDPVTTAGAHAAIDALAKCGST